MFCFVSYNIVITFQKIIKKINSNLTNETFILFQTVLIIIIRHIFRKHHHSLKIRYFYKLYKQNVPCFSSNISILTMTCFRTLIKFFLLISRQRKIILKISYFILKLTFKIKIKKPIFIISVFKTR